MNKWSLNIKWLFLLVAMMSFFSTSAQFTDNFTDGDFTNNPTWSGNNSLFTITSGELNSQSPTAANYYLSTPSTIASNVEFIFELNLKFATSGSNYVDVYLMSDVADLLNPSNGYFVRIGSTQDDIKLYKITGGTEALLIDGADASVNSSTNNPFRIKVTRDASNLWTLLYDDGILGSYLNAGSIVDPQHSSSAFFGVKIIQSSAASVINNHFFDNFYVGTIGADVTPPAIDSVVVVNTNNIDVYFNETVELSSSQTIGNYSVNNGIGNPISATRDLTDSSMVHLSFAASFTNGMLNTLTVNNVEDISSNPTANTTKTFTYLVIVVPNYRDIVINEIFADPTPQVGLPTVEFVELYNPSSTAYNLLGWKFINTTTVKTLPNFVLAPNGYVILCNSTDTALFTPYGNVIGISSFTALTNGGDSLTLMDNNNVLLDAVAYDISWYQDAVKSDGGWTLELINPTNNCGGSLNWTSSISLDGGTPGTQNSVYSIAPDITAPQISSVVVNSLSQLTVNFNETMDSTSLANATITINNGISVVSRVVLNKPNKVVLNVTPNLDSTTVYTVQLLTPTDCSGNNLSPNSTTFGIGASPEPFDLVINEIFADPDPTVGLPLFEYIELFNKSNKIIDLSGLKVVDPLSTSGFLSGKLLPNEYIIVCSSTSIGQFTPYGKVVGPTSFPSLNNSSDSIKLIKASGEIIHQVNYSDTWYQDATKKDGGWSLEMIDPNNPCGEENNWRASTKWFGGTPGTQNAIFGSNPDNVAPQLISAFALNDSTVQITFNENTFLGTLSINNGITINTIQQLTGKTYLITLVNKLAFQTTYTITANSITDCIGNLGNSNFNFSLPEQGLAGDVVINEVLFNPYTGGSDFVEIYNNSNKYINLQNWYLANYDNDSISNKKLITAQSYVLYPGEFTVLTKDANNIKTEYINAKQDRMLQMATLPTYNNSDGNVYLINNLSSTVDNFKYDEKMHFALLNDVKGVSLERIDYNRLSSDKTNWHSAAEDVGFATPGYENSQFQKAEINDEITISPETFSPDNDGIDDVVNISYQFAEGGYVANIVIYDSKGRLTKNLLLNELLGTSGTFSWDGINENNEKSAIGIYIIYIEIFNLKGEVKKFKKTCVLGGHF
ncbi:MAG: lamin tail domain-containing protein [Flavobacteriales bacterium]|nr:lamin tail domain-containing protein [Flavobacteriales bacterium]